MKMKILSLMLCFAVSAQLQAQSSECTADQMSATAETSSVPSNKYKILAGTVLTLLVGSGLYYFLKPDQRRVVNRHLDRNLLGPVLGGNLPQDPNAGFDKGEIQAAIEASLAMLTEKIKEPQIQVIASTEKPTEKKRKVRTNMYMRANALAAVNDLVDEPAFKSKNLGSSFTVHGEEYLSINTDTDFADQHASYAIILPDEILVLNSETREILNPIYQQLIQAYNIQFPDGCEDRKVFFAFLINFMRTHVFNVAKSRSHFVRELIQELMTVQDTVVLKGRRSTIPVINLSHYIRRGIGVCRHYSLVLAYLIQRFMDDVSIANNPIGGGSIHVDAAEEHIWCVYLNANERAGCHIDALWDLWIPISMNMDSKLDNSMIERMIQKDKEVFLEDSFVAPEDNKEMEVSGTPQWLKEAGIYNFASGESENGDIQFDEEILVQSGDWMSKAGIYEFSTIEEEDQ